MAPRTNALSLLALASLVACDQSALLGSSGQQFTITKADGGTIAPSPDAPPELRDFLFVVHPNAVDQDLQVTLRLGAAGDDINSAGPSVILEPLGTVLHVPADLTLPYSLRDHQDATKLFVELGGVSSSTPSHIDRNQLQVDAKVIHCQLNQLSEVHALAPHACEDDEECASVAFCHDGFCRPRLQADGGPDPEYDGGRHP